MTAVRDVLMCVGVAAIGLGAVIIVVAAWWSWMIRRARRRAGVR